MSEEIELLKNRLANTEKALLALATLLEELQPSYKQEEIHNLMSSYFDAQETLGFERNAEFIKGNLS